MTLGSGGAPRATPRPPRPAGGGGCCCADASLALTATRPATTTAVNTRVIFTLTSVRAPELFPHEAHKRSALILRHPLDRPGRIEHRRAHLGNLLVRQFR